MTLESGLIYFMRPLKPAEIAFNAAPPDGREGVSKARQAQRRANNGVISMAQRLRAGGAKPKPKDKKPRIRAVESQAGANTISSEEAIEAMEELFDLHDELASTTGAIRKRIAEEYANVAKRLDVPQKIVKHEFALERFRRKTAKREADFDGQDRDALMKLAQIFGEDSPFGQFAMRAAGAAKVDRFGGSADAEADDGQNEPENESEFEGAAA